MKLAIRIWPLCLAIAAAVAAHGQTKRALLIGINQYNWPGKPRTENAVRKTIPNLQGCVNDAVAMADMITTPKWGFARENVQLLIKPQEPTREAILSALRKLTETSQRGDTVFFFYSGHGGQVKNSASKEADGRDETIIPADTLYGAKDITDKELARVFVEVLDKGIKLTILMDCCHSGSGTRGLRDVFPKQAQESDGDTKDTYDISPSKKGALILASARDFEIAEEDRSDSAKPHGAFTKCLLPVLGSMDVNAPVRAIMTATRARLKSSGMFSQEPVPEASEERLGKGLFGDDASPGGKLKIAVLSVEDGQVILQGGYAFGIRPGCELSHPSVGAEKVRVQIVGRPSISRAEAKVIKGNASLLQPGAFLEVATWTSSGEPNLKVWIPPSTWSAAEILQRAQGLKDSGATLAESPVEGPASKHVRLTPGGWILAPAGVAVADLASLAGQGPVFASLPPPADLRAKLGFSKADQSDAVEVVEKPEAADYWLTGRARAGRLEYSWIRPAALGDDAMPLPSSTEWFAASKVDDLKEYALRLAAVKGWLTLESPPESRAFPYKLEVRETKTGKPVAGTTLKEAPGDEAPYQLWLAMDPSFKGAVIGRHVYVFALTRSGKATLLFPAEEGLENFFPLKQQQPRPGYPLVDISIEGPEYGPETFVLVTSKETLPTTLFQFDGVREFTRDTPKTALQRLIQQTWRGTRASGPKPTDWSVDRLLMRSSK